MAAPADHFVTTWKTDNPGSTSNSSITVPMVGGPYDVDWNNDGVFDEFGLHGTVVHDFGVANVYTVRIAGEFDSIKFRNVGDKQKIISLDQWGTNAWTTMSSAFWGTYNLVIEATDVPNLSNVSAMDFMFQDAILADPDTSAWDTSSVTNMSFMFFNADSANPDTSNWDTSSVTTMAYMFYGALTANPDTSGWDTSSVTNMAGMFLQASSANPDASGWNTSNVTNMQAMFSGAPVANPDTANWDTSNVTNMGGMFNGAVSANPDTGGWNTSSVSDMQSMFLAAPLANPDTSGWNTSAVTSMAEMFMHADSANPDTSGWDTSAVLTMRSMFEYADSASPDTSGWDTSSVTDMSFMFHLAPLANPDTSGWDTSSVTSMREMFHTASSAAPDTSGWNTAAVHNMKGMFFRANSANPDTGGWDTSSVTDMSYMFSEAPLANPDTSGWDTSFVTDMSGMFSDAPSANPDVTGWDTGFVTKTQQMFKNASSFDRDLGSWDISALQNASGMFAGIELSTANYDSLLMGWGSQDVNSGVPFSGGNSTYCSPAAAQARTDLMTLDAWSITDGGEAPCATTSLTLVKEVINDNGGSAGAGAWTLTASGATDFSGHGPMVTSPAGFEAGTYDLSESGPAGYAASAWECVGGSQNDDDTVTVGDGQSVSCTITNDDISPTLTVFKSIVNDNGGTENDPNAFGLRVDGGIVQHNATNQFDAGPHNVSEDGLPGYNAGPWGGDCNSDGTITLALGQDATCTITNDDTAATSLVLIMSVTNNDGGTASASQWTLSASGPTPFSGPGPNVPSPGEFSAGTYDLSENGPAGYSSSAWVCVGGTQNDDDTVTVGIGESVSCTITSDDISPTLTLFKNIVNDNGGTEDDPNAFGLRVDGGLVQHNVANEFNAGGHTVSEDGLAGYIPGPWGGDCNSDGTITLALAQDATCTVTNDDSDETSLTLVKSVINNDGGTATASQWTLSASGPTPFSGQGPNVPSPNDFSAGTYHLSEDGPAGYETGPWECVGGTQQDDDTITVELGESATCTVTNDDIAPILTVIKTIVNDNGGTENDPNAFGLRVDGDLVEHNVAYEVEAGPHTVSEDGLPGYEPGSWGGDCNSDGTITLELAQDATCMITNDDSQATMLLIDSFE